MVTDLLFTWLKLLLKCASISIIAVYRGAIAFSRIDLVSTLKAMACNLSCRYTLWTDHLRRSLLQILTPACLVLRWDYFWRWVWTTSLSTTEPNHFWLSELLALQFTGFPSTNTIIVFILTLSHLFMIIIEHRLHLFMTTKKDILLS